MTSRNGTAAPDRPRHASFSTESGSESASSERRQSRSGSPGRQDELVHMGGRLPVTAGSKVRKSTPRIYPALWRTVQEVHSTSASVPSLRDLAQTLIERSGAGQSGSTTGEVCSISSLSEIGTDPVNAGLRRPASYRELSQAKEVIVARRWTAARWQLVVWFCCCCVTVLISFWWFGLGVVVGATGLVGAVTGLRHDHIKHPVLRPIKAAQLFGALSALLAAACLGLFAFLWGSIIVSGAGRARPESTRYMIPAVSLWFLVHALICIRVAHTATGLIAELAPTQYMPQSMIVPAENVEQHLTSVDSGNHELQSV